MLTLGALVALVASGCAAGSEAPIPEDVPYSTFVLELPEEHGSARRSPVVFDHLAHAVSLQDVGCVACHSADGESGRFPLMAEALPGGDRDDLMNLYHDGCLSCHRQQERAPLTCGECHPWRKAPTPRSLDRRPAPFMDRHHDLHTKALDNRCGDCHHQPDKKTGELEYLDGGEAPCGDCHKRDGSGDAPSLRSASHAACVGCHLRRLQERKKTGTIECEGCHSEPEP